MQSSRTKSVRWRWSNQAKPPSTSVLLEELHHHLLTTDARHPGIYWNDWRLDQPNDNKINILIATRNVLCLPHLYPPGHLPQDLLPAVATIGKSCTAAEEMFRFFGVDNRCTKEHRHGAVCTHPVVKNF
jgi:hypothetical protein